MLGEFCHLYLYSRLQSQVQLYVAGLPLRWDKPEINENILNLNAYLEHK